MEKRLAAIKLAKQRKESRGGAGDPKAALASASAPAPSTRQTSPRSTRKRTPQSKATRTSAKNSPASGTQTVGAGAGRRQRSPARTGSRSSAATGDASLKKLLVRNEELKAEKEQWLEETAQLEALLEEVTRELNAALSHDSADAASQAQIQELTEQLEAERKSREEAEATVTELTGLLQHTTTELERVNEQTAVGQGSSDEARAHQEAYAAEVEEHMATQTRLEEFQSIVGELSEELASAQEQTLGQAKVESQLRAHVVELEKMLREAVTEVEAAQRQTHAAEVLSAAPVQMQNLRARKPVLLDRWGQAAWARKPRCAGHSEVRCRTVGSGTRRSSVVHSVRGKLSTMLGTLGLGLTRYSPSRDFLALMVALLMAPHRGRRRCNFVCVHISAACQSHKSVLVRRVPLTSNYCSVGLARFGVLLPTWSRTLETKPG